MPRLWTLGNLCRRRPRGTLESPPRPPVLISLGYLHCAPETHSESWIHYSCPPLELGRGKSQNAPAAISESPSLSIGQFYSQAEFERGKSATIARVCRASGGVF